MVRWRENFLLSPVKPLHIFLQNPNPNKTLSFSLHRTHSTKPTMTKEKRYWLLKTEPGEWSWDDQSSNGGITQWDGVKNKQAQKNLKSMRLNDLCFFYHSGAKSRRIVGVVSVVREWYDDGKDGAVDVKEVGEMRRQVDLKEMKGEKGLKGFELLRQPRLSVVPVTQDVWERICEMGGGYEGDGKVVEEES